MIELTPDAEAIVKAIQMLTLVIAIDGLAVVVSLYGLLKACGRGKKCQT